MAERTVPSGVFQKTYHRETEPVIVTVQGRPIGRWTPIGATVATGTASTETFMPEAPAGVVAPLTAGPIRPQKRKAFPDLTKRAGT